MPAIAAHRRALIDAALITPVECDAGAAGKDQLLHALLAASGNDILRTDDVGLVEKFPGPQIPAMAAV